MLQQTRANVFVMWLFQIFSLVNFEFSDTMNAEYGKTERGHGGSPREHHEVQNSMVFFQKAKIIQVLKQNFFTLE